MTSKAVTRLHLCSEHCYCRPVGYCWCPCSSCIVCSYISFRNRSCTVFKYIIRMCIYRSCKSYLICGTSVGIVSSLIGSYRLISNMWQYIKECKSANRCNRVIKYIQLIIYNLLTVRRCNGWILHCRRIRSLWSLCKYKLKRRAVYIIFLFTWEFLCRITVIIKVQCIGIKSRNTCSRRCLLIIIPFKISIYSSRTCSNISCKLKFRINVYILCWTVSRRYVYIRQVPYICGLTCVFKVIFNSVITQNSRCNFRCIRCTYINTLIFKSRIYKYIVFRIL